jgi:hypothetical protein
LVPDPSPFEVAFAIAKLKRHKSPGGDEIPAELIQAGGQIRVLINSVRYTEELADQWKEPIILPIYKKGAKTYQ